MILAVAMWVFVVAEGTMWVGGLAEYNDKVGPRFGHEMAPDHTGPHSNREEVKRRPIASALLSRVLCCSLSVLWPLSCSRGPLWLQEVLDRFYCLLHFVQTKYNSGRSPCVCVHYHVPRVLLFLVAVTVRRLKLSCLVHHATTLFVGKTSIHWA